MPHSVTIADLAATESFGQWLGCRLFPGAVVALVGPLGAGKTHLTRAIAEGVGIANSALVNSPTFVLIQEYPARIPIYHFDAYRLTSAEEFAQLGVDEYFAAEGICIIEWADKVAATLPTEHLQIGIEIVDEQLRQFTITASGTRHSALRKALLEWPGT